MDMQWQGYGLEPHLGLRCKLFRHNRVGSQLLITINIYTGGAYGSKLTKTSALLLYYSKTLVGPYIELR